MKELYAHFLRSTGVATDTRKIQKGQLFFALKGESFNGNTYAQKAIDSGAYMAVIDEPEYIIEGKTIVVKNVLESLQKLSNYHRHQLDITIVGLTGSNGKTTTKELMYTVLSSEKKCQCTQGNFNNHIGVPLTLLSFTKDTEIGIVEMGANHQKEIEFLCEIAEPDLGYITNFGKAHLEGFGGVEGVIKGKTELYQFLSKNQGTVLLNTDDPIQVEKSKNIPKKVTFGLSTKNDFRVELKAYFPSIEFNLDNTIVKAGIFGEYNATNIMAAVTLGRYFGVSNSSIAKQIATYSSNNNRSQIIHTNDKKTIILDAYNANPSSITAALSNLEKVKGSKMAIIGDMLELGEYSTLEHQKIVDVLEKMNLENFILVGPEFGKTNHSNALHFETTTLLCNYLKDTNFHSKTVLIKGSRGIQLETVVDLI